MKRKKTYNICILPLLAVIVIVPLIMRMYVFDTGLSNYSWYNATTTDADFFLFYKGLFLSIFAAIMTVIMVYFIIKDRKRRLKKITFTDEYWMIGLGFYFFFAAFSTLVSRYRYFGIHGISDQFESVFVITAYCICTVYTYYMIRSESDLRTISIAVLVLCLILGTLGLFQLLGIDFWESTLGRILMVPSEYASQRETLSFNFAGSEHPVYLTLYNINYVGVFCILMIPVLVALFFVVKNRILKVLCCAALVLLLICLIGCGSKTGILVFILIGAVAIIALIQKKKRIVCIGVFAIVLLLLGAGYYFFSGVNIVTRLSDSLKPVKNAYTVTDYTVAADDVCLTYLGETLHFQTDVSNEYGVQIGAWNESGTELALYQDDQGVIRFEDDKFKDISVSMYGDIGGLDFVAIIDVNGQYFRFTKQDGTYQFVNGLGRVDVPINADSAVFTNYDALFSGRGYIWSRTIPLVKKTLFVGTGADTFMLVFPNTDYTAKQNAGYGNQVVNKPHNLYLQIAVQLGIPALLGYLFTYIWYFRQTIRIIRKGRKSAETILASGILFSLLGYCIMGLINDSSVTIAPLAFVLLGLGFAVNRMIMDQRTTKKQDNNKKG